MIMNQTAISMTTDNSRNRKQANHRGPVCILICVCMHRCAGGGRADQKNRARVACGEVWGDSGGGWGVRARAKGLSSLPGCMLLSLALSSPIKPATPQQYGAINYRHAAINAERRERRGEAGTHKQDKRPHKRPAATQST